VFLDIACQQWSIRETLNARPAMLFVFSTAKNRPSARRSANGIWADHQSSYDEVAWYCSSCNVARAEEVID
jgi:hypothetical protein